MKYHWGNDFNKSILLTRFPLNLRIHFFSLLRIYLIVIGHLLSWRFSHPNNNSYMKNLMNSSFFFFSSCSRNFECYMYLLEYIFCKANKHYIFSLWIDFTCIVEEKCVCVYFNNSVVDSVLRAEKIEIRIEDETESFKNMYNTVNERRLHFAPTFTLLLFL